MPSVVCIMLANGREAMVQRAINSYRAQRYPLDKRLLYVLDTGPVPMFSALPDTYPDFGIQYHRSEQAGRTIGELRNYAASWQTADIILHWDSDDWAHPERIAEQVELLKTSGKQCVGYRDMLFWETCGHPAPSPVTPVVCPNCGGWRRAWLYQNGDPRYCIGTSLCYWRSVWSMRKFPHLPKPGKECGGVGEDVEWLREIDSLGVSALMHKGQQDGEPVADHGVPRMIASIHGGNTQYYNPAEYVEMKRGNSWTRAMEWDAYCAERMRL